MGKEWQQEHEVTAHTESASVHFLLLILSGTPVRGRRPPIVRVDLPISSLNLEATFHGSPDVFLLSDSRS